MDSRVDKNMNELNIADLNDAVKKSKVELERVRMENLWMEKFLRENSSLLASSREKMKNSVKFASVLSVRGSQVLAHTVQTPRFITKPKNLNSIDPSLKTEMCERETYKIEAEMRQKQKTSLQQIKSLVAETQETQITCKELQKAISEFETFVLQRGFDPMTNKVSTQVFTTFIKDLARNGSINTESIRMKTSTMKNDFRRQKRLFMKRQELSSCLRPVDFELALIEKKKFQNLHEEKLKHFVGLKNEQRDAFLSKNQEEKKLLQATIEYNQITAKANLSERRKILMERSIEASNEKIAQLKQSIKDFDELISVNEAPSVDDYIGKITERDRLKIELKAVKRKAEIAKISLQNAKLKTNKN